MRHIIDHYRVTAAWGITLHFLLWSIEIYVVFAILIHPWRNYIVTDAIFFSVAVRFQLVFVQCDTSRVVR